MKSTRCHILDEYDDITTIDIQNASQKLDFRV